jgi:hypothetical protein
MALLRWVILQVVLCAALVALWMMGPLAQVFASEARWYVSGVVLLAGVGLVLSALSRQDGAARIQDLLPVVAVVAMQVGILSALGVMAQALMSDGDPSKAVGGFFSALSTALYVSVAALGSYLWLRINLWLVHGE